MYVFLGNVFLSFYAHFHQSLFVIIKIFHPVFFLIATGFYRPLFLFQSMNSQRFCFGFTAIGAVIMGSVDGNRIWGKDIKAVQLAKVEVS